MDINKFLENISVPYLWLVMAVTLFAFVVIKTADKSPKK